MRGRCEGDREKDKGKDRDKDRDRASIVRMECDWMETEGIEFLLAKEGIQGGTDRH